MPIMASQGRVDARGVAQLLADTALSCIDNPNDGPEQQVALDNVYRLLESYRTNLLTRLGTSEDARELDEPERLTLRRPIERNVNMVRDALDHALRQTYGDIGKQEAIGRLENVLRGVAYPELGVKSNSEDLRCAHKFFSVVLERL